MNILIEDAETHRFLIKDGRWTTKADEGTSFESTRGALAAGKGEPIGKFNIVGHFPNTVQFFNMDHGTGKGE